MQILYGLLANAPQMTAAIIGVVLAAVFWRRMPGPALLLLLGSIIEMLVLLASGWYHFVYLPAAVQAREQTTIELARHAAVVGVATSVLQGIAFGMLVWAVVAGRGRQLPAVAGR
ncbi:hypothetical protein [Dyella jiangningensis]|nr:hypothetical protein [Dyella jiangningensis]